MTGWDDLDTRLEEVNLPFVALSRRNVRANARQSGLSSPTPINYHVANILPSLASPSSGFRSSILPRLPITYLTISKEAPARVCGDAGPFSVLNLVCWVLSIS
jgi:hypothetical protein